MMIELFYEAARMTCVFLGGLMVLAGLVRALYGHPVTHRKVSMSALNTRAIVAGICGVAAFVPPLLSDMNVWLSAAPNPYTALTAVHCLLWLQVSLARTIAENPKSITRTAVLFYIFSGAVAVIHKAGI